MRTIQIKLPKPHAAQRAVLQALGAGRFHVLCCGRRWGKTTLAEVLAVQQVLAGKTVIYTAPTYRQTRQTWMRLRHTLRRITTRISETDRVLEVLTGGGVAAYSLDNPDTIRGDAADWVIVDEAAFVRDLKANWHQTLRPLLTDRAGSALFISTPRGHNDFHELYLMAERDPDWRSYHYPSSSNPHLPPAELEAARRALPLADYQQEYEALFTSRAGLIFDTWSDENVQPVEYNPNLPVYWGVDDGYVHGEGLGSASYHPRVILFVQVQPDGAVHVIDEIGVTQQLAEQTIAEALARPYARPHTAFVDSSAQELRARLHANSIQTVNATHPVEEGIQVVRRYVLDGAGRRLLLVSPRCRGLIYNFRHYAYERADGHPRPEKRNDDYIDALRYVMYKLMRHR